MIDRIPSGTRDVLPDEMRELRAMTDRMHAVFENPPRPVDGLFHLPTEPGLGLTVNEAELAKRRVPIG